MKDSGRIIVNCTQAAMYPSEHGSRAVADGADLLKVIASGAVLAYGGVPGEPQMTPAEIAAVVEVAHAHGLKVAAHAHGAQSIREAILAGADTIEHVSLIDDAAIGRARRHDVALSMDVYNGDYIDTAGRAQGAGRRNSCARTSRPPRRSARVSPGRTPPGCRLCTARMRRCTRMGSTPGSSRSWCDAA